MKKIKLTVQAKIVSRHTWRRRLHLGADVDGDDDNDDDDTENGSDDEDIKNDNDGWWRCQW